MKISFNLISCGLGNNGGSTTIIRSANTLHELGHEVTIVDSGKNKHTWNDIKCNHLIIKDLSSFPFGDAVIATGFRTVESTLELDDNCGKKYHWIRLLENHICNEKELINVFKAPTIKIVNSICLQRKLLEYNEPSIIIRPGYDFDEIYPLNIRKKNEAMILGGLYNEGSKRANKRTEWIFNVYDYLKNQGQNVKLYMFGSDGTPSKKIDKYLKDPPIIQKNELFNQVDIWLAPSSLEGLHIAPAEAMLTECACVGTDADQSGTEDYLINCETGLVSSNTFNSFINHVEALMNNKKARQQFGKDGREKVKSLGDRKDNMRKLVHFLEG